MAGRGADIRVRLPVTGVEHNLSVGLHTPLSIFRAQLAKLTGIAVRVRPRDVASLQLARRGAATWHGSAVAAQRACRAGVC